METSGSDKKPSAFRMMRYASIGLELISPIVGGAIAGYYIGEHFNKPWLALVFLFAGIFLGFYRLVVELRNFQKGL
ncbi:MAG: AtpZ/AtpI family protein [Candidatus Binataceae bacterium]